MLLESERLNGGHERMSIRAMKYDMEQGLSLALRVDSKYQPVFEKQADCDRAALALYFLPHQSKKEILEVTRPRIIKWYCPFADQRLFPSGHRYCINVYTGCEHRCQYCYATGYISAQPNCKNDFRRDLIKDLDALDLYNVPPAPVHLSNSTDPFQPLEQEHHHTLYAMEKLAERRRRFTTVTILTKNPAMLMDEKYINELHRLNELPKDHPRRQWFETNGYTPLRVECSLAFYNEQHRHLLDPSAPSVESRMTAIRFLREKHIPVHVRIDPLFPRDPLLNGKTMSDFDLPDVQPLEDLEAIVRFCREIGVGQIIYSVAKITQPRAIHLSVVMQKMKCVYEHLAEKRLVLHGGSWRLPEIIAKEFVINPFLDLCHQYSVAAKTCKANLISTP
jgi:DNA repair photolyase